MQELASDPPIHSNRPRYLVHVAANFFTEISDLIDERYLGGQEGIRRILDQFGAFQRSNDKRRFYQIKRTIEIAHYRDGLLIAAANYYAVGPHEITDRSAFPQKFWIRDHAKAQWLWLMLAELEVVRAE